jgi:hypothetical protein
MRWVSLTIALLVALTTAAQPDTVNVPNSTNGWYLSPHGTIRVLVLFCELEYDKNPARDPQPDGASHWRKGQLPNWRDELFDPQPAAAYLGQITRYYHDMSLGRYTVLGDYIDTILTIRESEHPGLGNAHGIGALAVKEANELGALRTRHRLAIADFDLWQRGGKPGLPKRPGPDSPHSYDHVMVIARNSGLTHNQGSTDPGSPGKLFGFESDSQSRFGGMYALPYEILQHEFNHLLFGGNNFHAGGGNASQFVSYFPWLQGGWSMMGGSNSALLTGNAWDRDRLGWAPEGAAHRIRARGADGREVNGDIDPYNGDTGVFVLRDFMTTGDALRIRLPFLGDDEYPQWIWLENHQGHKRNGVLSDQFHYESVAECTAPLVPGLFAYVQVDRDNRYGRDVYGQHSDYLRALCASGHHDFELRGDTVPFECLWPKPTTPYKVGRASANPLTGQQDLELPLNPSSQGRLDRGKHYVPRIEMRDGQRIDQGHFFGHSRQVFTPQGNRKLGMCTNPSTANMVTLLNQGGNAVNRAAPPDNRVVHLNGIAAEVLEQREGGDLVVRITNDDRRLSNTLRWCADSIVLHHPPHQGRPALLLDKGSELILDRSGTPTRLDRPERAGGRTWYASPTRLVISPGAHVTGAARSALTLRNGSELHVLPGARLELHRKARLTVERDSRIVLHGSAEAKARPRALRKLRKQGRLVTAQ